MGFVEYLREAQEDQLYLFIVLLIIIIFLKVEGDNIPNVTDRCFYRAVVSKLWVSPNILGGHTKNNFIYFVFF